MKAASGRKSTTIRLGDPPSGDILRIDPERTDPRIVIRVTKLKKQEAQGLGWLLISEMILSGPKPSRKMNELSRRLRAAYRKGSK